LYQADAPERKKNKSWKK